MYNKKIKELRASAMQLLKLQDGCSNSFTEETRMVEALILLTEADRLQCLQKSCKKSVSL